MIDIHCHLLPFTDDGPKSWETTLEMCRIAAADGIREMVATPHCDARYPYDRVASQEKINQLQEQFPAIRFHLGCEFTINENNLQKINRDPRNFTIGSTNYILVETNEALLPRQNRDALYELISLGLSPVLAHPERSALMRKNIPLVEEWASMGCTTAITSNSITGFWGKEIKQCAENMLKKGLVNYLVTDAHNTDTRVPIFSSAVTVVRKIVGEEEARKMVFDAPKQVVGN